MPLYDLKCTNPNCEYEYEDIIKLDDAEDIKCPKCGSLVERLITLVTPKHLSWAKWNTKLEG